MHSRQLYYTSEGFNAQQKALLHRRKLYCTLEGFIAQQEVLLHSRKVSYAAETGETFLLRQKHRISPLCSVFPWTQRLRINWQRQNGTLKPILRSARPNFLPRKRNVKRTLYSYLLKCGFMSKLSIKCSFGQLIFCQLSLLFILFLLLFMAPLHFWILFMGLTVLFQLTFTILRAKSFQFQQNKQIPNKP